MLIEVIKEELIIEELKGKGKDEVIKEMVSVFKKAGIIESEKEFIKDIKKRESIETTGIGDGIAIPHARSENVRKIAVCFARSRNGIDFNSLDGKLVHLIFMIASPLDTKKEYLQVLARIARLCKNEKIKESLLKAKDKGEILGFIKGFDLGSGKIKGIKLKEGRAIYSE